MNNIGVICPASQPIPKTTARGPFQHWPDRSETDHTGAAGPPRAAQHQGIITVDGFTLLFPNTAAALARIEKKVDTIMATVKIEQESLDQFAADIAEATDAIATELANLVASAENPLTDADVTSLQTAVDSLKNLEPPQVNPL
jgi:hypothetical protein